LGFTPLPTRRSSDLLERVLKALRTHLASPAHLLGLASGAALLRKKRLRVGLRAQCALLPAQLFTVCAVRQRDDHLAHSAPPCPWNPLVNAIPPVPSPEKALKLHPRNYTRVAPAPSSRRAFRGDLTGYAGRAG